MKIQKMHRVLKHYLQYSISFKEGKTQFCYNDRSLQTSIIEG